MESNQNKHSFDRYIKERKTENPFFQNYLFSEEDLKRVTIKKWQYPLLWFLPTYVQLSEEYEVHFKLWQGRVFLMGMLPFNDVNATDSAALR